MDFLKSIVIVGLMSCAQIAYAGMPVQQEEICPVGGKTFKTTGTASCSTMGHTISLKQVTSCDFVTHLPQCPGNKLPMYKEFTDSDLFELEQIMESKEYKTFSKGSPYRLAAFIEQKLSSFDRETLYFLLQNGIWRTPEQVMNDADYMSDYHTAANNVFELFKEEERPFWRGAQAFVHMQQGNLNAAKNAISIMKKENSSGKEYLTTYIQALEFCIENSDDAELCSADTSLRAHKNKDEKKK